MRCLVIIESPAPVDKWLGADKNGKHGIPLLEVTKVYSQLLLMIHSTNLVIGVFAVVFC